jgi:hypothetical protein
VFNVFHTCRRHQMPLAGYFFFMHARGHLVVCWMFSFCKVTFLVLPVNVKQWLNTLCILVCGAGSFCMLLILWLSRPSRIAVCRHLVWQTFYPAFFLQTWLAVLPITSIYDISFYPASLLQLCEHDFWNAMLWKHNSLPCAWVLIGDIPAISGLCIWPLLYRSVYVWQWCC